MKGLATVFAIAGVVAILAVEGGAKFAYAEYPESATCTIGTTVLCRTVVEMRCTDWVASTLSLGMTSVGGGTTCGTWTTTTSYFYWSALETGGILPPTKKLT